MSSKKLASSFNYEVLDHYLNTKRLKHDIWFASPYSSRTKTEGLCPLQSLRFSRFAKEESKSNIGTWTLVWNPIWRFLSASEARRFVVFGLLRGEQTSKQASGVCANVSWSDRHAVITRPTAKTAPAACRLVCPKPRKDYHCQIACHFRTLSTCLSCSSQTNMPLPCLKNTD